jgi:hypothetical protein
LAGNIVRGVCGMKFIADESHRVLRGGAVLCAQRDFLFP